MPRRRRLWCPRPWRSRTHESEKPLQATGLGEGAAPRGQGWLCSLRVSSLSPSLDLSSLPAISRCVIAFKCLPHHAHCLLHMWVVSCESLRRRGAAQVEAVPHINVWFMHPNAWIAAKKTLPWPLQLLGQCLVVVVVVALHAEDSTVAIMAALWAHSKPPTRPGLSHRCIQMTLTLTTTTSTLSLSAPVT